MSAFTALALWFYNRRVILIRSTRQLPAIIMVGSFFTLAGLAVLTSPAKTIAVATFFFAVLAIFLISAGVFVARRRSGAASSSQLFKIVVVSLFVTLLLMLRSAQSLDFWGVLIICLTLWGLMFYAKKRTK